MNIYRKECGLTDTEGLRFNSDEVFITLKGE